MSNISYSWHLKKFSVSVCWQGCRTCLCVFKLSFVARMKMAIWHYSICLLSGWSEFNSFICFIIINRRLELRPVVTLSLWSLETRRTTWTSSTINLLVTLDWAYMGLLFFLILDASIVPVLVVLSAILFTSFSHAIIFARLYRFVIFLMNLNLSYNIKYIFSLFSMRTWHL